MTKQTAQMILRCGVVFIYAGIAVGLAIIAAVTGRAFYRFAVGQPTELLSVLATVAIPACAAWLFFRAEEVTR